MKAIIYTKNTCPWCTKAKALLKKMDATVVERIIGENGVTKESAEADLGRRITTVPQIVIDGEYIGGYTELKAHPISGGME